MAQRANLPLLLLLIVAVRAALLFHETTDWEELCVRQQRYDEPSLLLLPPVRAAAALRELLALLHSAAKKDDAAPLVSLPLPQSLERVQRLPHPRLRFEQFHDSFPTPFDFRPQSKEQHASGVALEVVAPVAWPCHAAGEELAQERQCSPSQQKYASRREQRPPFSDLVEMEVLDKRPA